MLIYLIGSARKKQKEKHVKHEKSLTIIYKVQLIESSGSELQDSVEPDRVKNHMEQIILNRFRVPKKMPLHLFNPHEHPKISLLRDRKKDVLQKWYILLHDKHSKGFPVQSLEKWWHEVIGYDHRDTFIEDGFNHSRAINFISSRANAILATLHVVNVVPIALRMRQCTKYLHFRVIVVVVVAPVL